MHPVRVDLGDVHLAIHGDGGEDFFDCGTNLAGRFLAFAEGEDGWTGSGNGEA